MLGPLASGLGVTVSIGWTLPVKGSQEKKAHNEGELQFPLPISLELPPRGVSPSSFPSLPLAFLCLAHLPVLLGSCVKWPPSECCNLSVMPWILSTKLLRACAWLWASEESPPLPPMLHCGISSAMLLMFGMEPNYHSQGSGGREGESEKCAAIIKLRLASFSLLASCGSCSMSTCTSTCTSTS